MLLVSRTRLGVEGISAMDAARRAAGLGATDIGLDGVRATSAWTS